MHACLIEQPIRRGGKLSGSDLRAAPIESDDKEGSPFINASFLPSTPLQDTSPTMSTTTGKSRVQLAPGKVVRIVFIALVCDLLAFTMP